MNPEIAGQRWNADDYARNARFVADLAAPLLDWLAPQAGERVLDLGCGDGALSEKIAATGAQVVGADASPELVAAARARGLDAKVIDGHALAFESEFDAAFSNAALHWMKLDPDAVIAGVYRALKPGGRFVAEMGAAGNCESIRHAAHAALSSRGVDSPKFDPWYFPSESDYRQRLEVAGFKPTRVECFQRPTRLPGDISGWLRTFGQSFFAALPTDAREPVIEEIRRKLEPILCRDGVWTADYVRLRFSAIKK